MCKLLVDNWYHPPLPQNEHEEDIFSDKGMAIFEYFGLFNHFYILIFLFHSPYW